MFWWVVAPLGVGKLRSSLVVAWQNVGCRFQPECCGCQIAPSARTVYGCTLLLALDDGQEIDAVHCWDDACEREICGGNQTRDCQIVPSALTSYGYELSTITGGCGPRWAGIGWRRVTKLVSSILRTLGNPTYPFHAGTYAQSIHRSSLVIVVPCDLQIVAA